MKPTDPESQFLSRYKAGEYIKRFKLTPSERAMAESLVVKGYLSCKPAKVRNLTLYRVEKHE